MSGRDEHEKSPSGPRFLGGDAPPPGLAGDLRALGGLPLPVRDALWEVLAPNLEAQIGEQATAAVNAFCEARRIRPDDLVSPIKACRYLFRQAARRNVSPEDLRGDLRALCGEGTSFEDRLVGWYERALPILRREIMIAALSAHGNLTTGVDWRLDSIQMSQDGEGLNVPVALLTFRYLKGDQKKRITMQFAPEMIRELHAICEKMLR